LSLVEVLTDPAVRRILNADPNFERLRYLIVLAASAEPPFDTGGTLVGQYVTFNMKQLWRVANRLGLDFERFRGAEKVFNYLERLGLARSYRNEQTGYRQYCASETGLAQAQLNLDRLGKIRQLESQAKTMQMTIKKQFSKQPPAILEIALGKGTCTIGREKSNDLAVDDPYMSSNHARIEYTSGQWILEDLRSRNGSWKVEPQGLIRVAHSTISDGDTYQIGSTVFRFRHPVRIDE
jgi:hypothetical protein